jgi:hypothetical protein
MHRIAAAVAGLSVVASLLIPAVMTTPSTSQAAAVVSAPVTEAVPVPAKPMLDGEDDEDVTQKCHIKFFPLVKHKLEYTHLVKLEIIVDVDCREEIGEVALFAESRLLEELDGVLDDAVTLVGATIIDKKDLDAGFCVDVEIDTDDHETHWGQCFFEDDEILSADDGHDYYDKGGYNGGYKD